VAKKQSQFPLIGSVAGTDHVDVIKDGANKRVAIANFLAAIPSGLFVPASGDSTVAGIKTFAAAPVVPDAAFSQDKVAGLVAALSGKAAAVAPSFLVDATDRAIDITATIDRATLRIYRYNPAALPPKWHTGAIFNSQGAYHTNAWVTISGHMLDVADGEGNYYPQPPTPDPFMLGVWSDIEGGALKVRTNTDSAIDRAVDVLSAAGLHSFSVLGSGEHRWGTGTFAEQDVTLRRSAAFALTVSSPAGSDPVFRVDSPAGRTAALGTSVNGAAMWNIAGSAVSSGYVQYGGATIFRAYNSTGGRATFGGADENSAVLSVCGNNNAVPTFRVRRNSAIQSVDIAQFCDEANVVLSRISKAGRLVQRVATAPVLADLADGDMAFSTNAGGDLVITSRIAGALKTATVAVA
jgi:hypothetical protein